MVEKGKDGLEVAQTHRKLFVLGRPGSGKTTFLKYLTLQSVQDPMTQIPIFISLRELSESNQSILDFTIQHFALFSFSDAAFFTKSVLESGKAIFLFDGLDEVSENKSLRYSIITQLRNFVNAYNACQYVITCRTAASEYIFQNFTDVEMADFTSEQIHSFVVKWFSNEAISYKFFSEFDTFENRRLHDLARNPLLLTLLCLCFEDNRTFPLHRTDIYKDAISVLLKKWDNSREIKRESDYKKLSLNRKKQLFSNIARETFEQNKYLLPYLRH